jgi:hypothetical protein
MVFNKENPETPQAQSTENRKCRDGTKHQPTE